MEEKIDTKKEFSLIKRAKSFTHAGRGIWIFVKTTENAWIHIGALLSVIILGAYLEISLYEWMALTFATGLVFISEAFNTALEIDLNLTSPEYHPYARDSKDVAAGAVLISALVALVIGLMVFVPYFV